MLALLEILPGRFAKFQICCDEKAHASALIRKSSPAYSYAIWNLARPFPLTPSFLPPRNPASMLPQYPAPRISTKTTTPLFNPPLSYVDSILSDPNAKYPLLVLPFRTLYTLPQILAILSHISPNNHIPSTISRTHSGHM